MSIVLDYKALEQIPGWLSKDEAEWLASIAQRCISWTEIGCYAGRSTTAVGFNLPQGATLQLVDIDFQPRFWQTIHDLVAARPDLLLSINKMSSAVASRLLPNTVGCFIDADHEYASVKQDIIDWQSKCSILCGHDYNNYWPGVQKAVNELCPNPTNPAYSIWVRR